MLIAALAVIASTLFGIYNSANQVTRQIEAMFYDGVYLADRGFTEPGINSHLENSADAVLGIVTVTEYFPELAQKTESLRSARRALLDAGSIAQKGSAALEMRAGFLELMAAADDVGLTAHDWETLAHHSRTFTGAFTAISGSGYNEAAAERLAEQSAILRLISTFLSADTPDFFNILPARQTF